MALVSLLSQNSVVPERMRPREPPVCSLPLCFALFWTHRGKDPAVNSPASGRPPRTVRWLTTKQPGSALDSLFRAEQQSVVGRGLVLC